MPHSSKHIIDLTNIFSHNAKIGQTPPNHTRDINSCPESFITQNINSPLPNKDFQNNNNGESSPFLNQKKNFLNENIKSNFNNIFQQLKTAMQFVALTIVIFIILFGLSNFSAYKEIVNYWYKTEVIKAEKEETPVDKLITPLEKQKTENIILNKGKISYVNFQIRPSNYRIYIPKINKNLPVIETQKNNLINQNWEGLEKDIQQDLRKGVVHYPGTSHPGEIGNAFLTAHSSWYPNDPLPYGLSSAFSLLDKLVVGDDVYIFYNGFMYIYKVSDKFIVKPDNVDVLNQPSDKRQMTLMTCHPVGTTLSRKILKLDLFYPKFDTNETENTQNQNNIENLYSEGKLQS